MCGSGTKTKTIPDYLSKPKLNALHKNKELPNILV
jgi:hypothetical protein